MAGHEGTPPLTPPANPDELEPEAGVGSLPPELEAIIVQKAAALAVEALEDVVMTLGNGLRTLSERLEALEARATADAPESRLDSLEARMESFGQGGETVGDALALAQFALATARAIAAAVERSQGVQIPLPPAPMVPALGEARVVGAELADAVAL